jgi:hypothetical protein
MEPTRNHDPEERLQRISFGLEDFQRYFGGLPVLARDRDYEAETKAREAGLVVIFSSSPLAGLLPESTPELGDLMNRDSSTGTLGVAYERQDPKESKPPINYQEKSSAPQTPVSRPVPMVDPVQGAYTRVPQFEQYLLTRQHYEMSSTGRGLEGRLDDSFSGAREIAPWHYYHSTGGRYH